MATTTSVQTGSIPTILEPYFIGDPSKGITGLLDKAIAETTKSYDQVYGTALEEAGLAGAGRVAGLSELQQQVADQLANAEIPAAFRTAAGIGSSAQSGLESLLGTQAQQIAAKNLQNYQMTAPGDVRASSYNAPTMRAASTDYAPDLQYFQMQAPRDISTGNVQQYQMAGPEKFTSETASEYMSPYIRNVLDVAKAEAIRDAEKTNLAGNLAAARQGTYGGARQLLAQTERERALGQNLARIEAEGMQDAFGKAMQQFQSTTGLQQQAAAQNLQSLLSTQQQKVDIEKANQQAGLTAAQQNLAAQLQTQGLSANQALEVARMNLSNEQQAAVQNMAAQLQTQGLNADQAMKAALANQQAQLTTGQQNLAAQLGVQQLGAQQALEAQKANQTAALQAADIQRQAAAGLGTLAGQMGQVGALESAATTDLMKTQGAMGDLQRAIEQQQIDAQYQDLMKEQGFGLQQVGTQANILRGVPVTDQTTTTTTPPPSFASQLAGAGLAGASVYSMLK